MGVPRTWGSPPLALSLRGNGGVSCPPRPRGFLALVSVPAGENAPLPPQRDNAGLAPPHVPHAAAGRAAAGVHPAPRGGESRQHACHCSPREGGGDTHLHVPASAGCGVYPQEPTEPSPDRSCTSPTGGGTPRSTWTPASSSPPSWGRAGKDEDVSPSSREGR